MRCSRWSAEKPIVRTVDPMRAALSLLPFAVAASLAGCAGSAATVAQPSPFPNAPVASWTPRKAPGAGTLLTRSHVVQSALSLRGVPYQLGGERPETGFDCSGLVRYVFNQYKIALPRTVAQQFMVGREVPINTIEAGDLIFFNTTAAHPSHVGVAVDATTFVHAPDNGSAVRAERFDTPYWTKRIAGVRRLEF